MLLVAGTVRRGALLFVLLSTAGATCHRSKQSDTDSHNMTKQDRPMAKTDVQQLAAFINLPYKPLAVRWETTAREGGNDWSLAALLTLVPGDARALVASSPQLGG